LYEPSGEYFYGNGFNAIALVALVLGILPNAPGFLGTIKVLDSGTVGPFFMRLYDYAWFVGFFISFVAYWVLTALRRNAQTER
jgi:NCS1 family nucleobase:cation symporter-1